MIVMIVKLCAGIVAAVILPGCGICSAYNYGVKKKLRWLCGDVWDAVVINTCTDG